MKHRLYLTLIILPLLLASSCVPVVDDVFDSPAAERMAAKLQELRTLLASAENGWLADYYPDKKAALGGYAMQFHFYTDGTVDVACEMDTHLPAGSSAESEYDIIYDQSVLLTFNTYNQVFHFFSEPKGSSDVDGWAGDYEFILMDITDAGDIVMKGKKWERKLVLRRCDAAFDFQAYIRDVENTFDAISGYGMFAFQSERDTNVWITGTVVDRTFNVTYNDTDTTSVTEKLPYTITNNGIRLYEPTTIQNVTFQNFVWNEADEKYACADPGVDIEGIPYFPPDYQLKYAEILGRWRLNYKAYLTNSVDTVEITLKKKNATFTLSCPAIFTFPYELTFDAAKGTIALVSQTLGFHEPSGYYIRACAYAMDPSGSASYQTSVGTYGMVGNWNHDEGGERKITLVNNGRWTVDANRYFGITLRTFTSAGTYVGTFTGNIGGGYRFTDMVLTKLED
jgi:hypothetical protein